MFGSRMAMEKLQAMDESYASRIGELINGDVAKRAAGLTGQESGPMKYLAGAQMPVADIKQVRQQINEEPMTAAERRADLQDVMEMELGAAGRYAIPAAGAGLGVAGIAGTASMMNNGSAYEIDYNSPAHGSNLAPESHAIYKEVHQGLMNGTVSSEELRAAVWSGEFDHDPQLVNHFIDVMG